MCVMLNKYPLPVVAYRWPLPTNLESIARKPAA